MQTSSKEPLLSAVVKSEPLNLSQQYSQTSPKQKCPQTQQQPQSTLIFNELIPFYGSMPIVFYMPQASNEDQDMIISNGGLMSSIVECFTFQIAKRPFKETQFFPGTIYDFRWLIDSVESHILLNPEPYTIKQIDYNYDENSLHNGNQGNSTLITYGGLSLSSSLSKKCSGQRTRFTIRELIKIFEVIANNPCKKNKNQVYWQRFIKKGHFPGRSVNSVNAQWQRFCHYMNVEEAIKKAIQMGMPYSTMYPSAQLDQTLNRYILNPNIIKSESALLSNGHHESSLSSSRFKVKKQYPLSKPNMNSKNTLIFKKEEQSEIIPLKQQNVGSKRAYVQSECMNNDEFNNHNGKSGDNSYRRGPISSGGGYIDGTVGLNDWSPGCSRSISRHSDDIIKVKHEQEDTKISNLKAASTSYTLPNKYQQKQFEQSSASYQPSNMTQIRIGPFNSKNESNKQSIHPNNKKHQRRSSDSSHHHQQIIEPPDNQIDSNNSSNQGDNIGSIPIECIFCIAKRIFVGSNNDIVSKTPLTQRFNHLDQQYEPLKIIQYNNLTIQSDLKSNRQVLHSSTIINNCDYSLVTGRKGDNNGFWDRNGNDQSDQEEEIINDEGSPSQFIDSFYK